GPTHAPSCDSWPRIAVGSGVLWDFVRSIPARSFAPLHTKRPLRSTRLPKVALMPIGLSADQPCDGDAEQGLLHISRCAGYLGTIREIAATPPGFDGPILRKRAHAATANCRHATWRPDRTCIPLRSETGQPAGVVDLKPFGTHLSLHGRGQADSIVRLSF